MISLRASATIKIQSNIAGANLYLINPSGIVFNHIGHYRRPSTRARLDKARSVVSLFHADRI